MHRKFIATILTAAIAITAMSVPARAGDRDVAKFLAALAGIAVIGAIVNDNKHDREARQRREQYTQPHRKHVKPLPNRVARKLLPGNCLRSHRTNRGRVRMFGNRCLENNYRHVDRLPNQCFQRVRSDKGTRKGYNAYCLRQHGYQIARN